MSIALQHPGGDYRPRSGQSRARGACTRARGEPFDPTLTLSLSKGERFAQDRLVEPRAVLRSSFDRLRTSGRRGCATWPLEFRLRRPLEEFPLKSRTRLVPLDRADRIRNPCG